MMSDTDSQRDQRVSNVVLSCKAQAMSSCNRGTLWNGRFQMEYGRNESSDSITDPHRLLIAEGINENNSYLA